MTNIYGLYDPCDPTLPMYIGKGLEKRAQSHWKIFHRTGRAVNALLRRWFEELREAGVEPIWRFIETNVATWQESEKEWIAIYKVCNPDLCNVSAGGNQWGGDHQAFGKLSHTESHRLDPDYYESRRRGGITNGGRYLTHEGRLKAGRKNAEKIGYFHNIGLLGALKQPRSGKILGAITANHKRWHLDRNLTSDRCLLCRRP
jgi:hypothetical protein